VLFISVYISSFVNLIAFENVTKKNASLSNIFNYTALLYSFSFLIYALEPILTIFFFYKIFLFYTIYIAWNGIEHFIEVPNDNKVVFTINNIDKVPFSDLEQIISNIEREDRFNFEYDELEQVKVKKKIK
jgi:hypothetical protein